MIGEPGVVRSADQAKVAVTHHCGFLQDRKNPAARLRAQCGNMLPHHCLVVSVCPATDRPTE